MLQKINKNKPLIWTVWLLCHAVRGWLIALKALWTLHCKTAANNTKGFGYYLYIYGLPLLLIVFISTGINHISLALELDNNKIAHASTKQELFNLEAKLLAKDKEQLDAVNKLLSDINSFDSKKTGKDTITSPIITSSTPFNDSLFFVDNKGERKIGLFVKPENKSKMVEKTQSYIDKYFNQNSKKSPMVGQTIVDMAEKANFPVGLILANAHLESHGATLGRGADSNNPHNIGNTDPGDGKMTVCGQYTNCLKDWTVGTQMFIKLITNCYMSSQIATTHEFINNDFRTQKVSNECSSVKIGSRYMTDINAPTKYRDISALINKNFLE